MYPSSIQILSFKTLAIFFGHTARFGLCKNDVQCVYIDIFIDFGHFDIYEPFKFQLSC